jgi:hypothetical protein
VGGWKGLVLFPKGRDGRGWSRISGELSKVSSFIKDDGTTLGKEVGSLSFAKVVSTVAPVFVKSAEKQRGVAWGELE